MALRYAGTATVFHANDRSGVKTLAKIAGRLLHRYRHRRAKRQVQRIRPRSILVVCHGNICRSPYLEAALRHLLPDLDISSAGLVRPGCSVPEHGVQLAARRGLDLTPHRSRLLTRDAAGRAELVLVMEESQARYLIGRVGLPRDRVFVAGDLDPLVGGRDIRDPWNEPLEVFETSYSRLDRCAAVVAASLGNRPLSSR